MNQTCKVCGEPAAGFHFGAFTCEGCKSFFGRSYNNLSSISECKNNGECVINKKNRTACKACRLRKCLMVGMSKSGSRYGRRSNWFKIHCLLQEQQQAAAAASGGGGSKSPTNSQQPGMAMPFHPGFSMGHHRPPTSDLMLLGLEEYTKMPTDNSTVSSPDSHNSDSSIDITDRSHMIKKFADNSQHHSPTSGGSMGHQHKGHSGTPNSNKDLFLPFLPSALSSMPMMPPPSFLPQSHLLFPGYHPALYSHHQGLLKPVDQHLMNSSLAFHHHQQQQHQQQNNNSRFAPNHNHPMFGGPLGLGGLNSTGSKQNKAAEELTKRFYLDAVLKSQMSPRNGIHRNSSPAPTQHQVHSQNEDEEEEEREDTDRPNITETCIDREDIDKNNNNSSSIISHSSTKTSPRRTKDDHEMLNAMTPPRSPTNSSHGGSGGQKLNSTPKATLVAAAALASAEMPKFSNSDISPTTSASSHQDNPIDLSMKTSSSTTSDENRSTSSVAGSDLDMDERLSEPSEPTVTKNSHPRSTTPILRNGDRDGSDAEDEEIEYDQAIKRMKFQGTTPLDLTTRV